MELINKIIDIALHLDRYLSAIIQQYGLWTYAILFVVIFIETGFVVMPFLPGDSLLFAAGTFAALGALKVGWLIAILTAAAIIGDTVNYWIGHFVGPKVFHKDKARFFKKEYLDRTHAFYEKHGGKTIIIARFVPIIRSFAPLVAGIGRMSYGNFIAYNVIGGVGLGRPARRRRLFLRQHPVRQEEFLPGHPGHHRPIDDPDRDRVSASPEEKADLPTEPAPRRRPVRRYGHVPAGDGRDGLERPAIRARRGRLGPGDSWLMSWCGHVGVKGRQRDESRRWAAMTSVPASPTLLGVPVPIQK